MFLYVLCNTLYESVRVSCRSVKSGYGFICFGYGFLCFGYGLYVLDMDKLYNPVYGLGGLDSTN